MKIVDIASKILSYGYVCDHCLGRQFSQLLSGYSHEERGRIIRTAVALSLDSGEGIKADDLNLSQFKFRIYKPKLKAKQKKDSVKDASKAGEKCKVCGNIFDNIGIFAKRAVEESKEISFSNFLVGVRLSKELADSEEKLWEATGIEYCESIKNEISRELGKDISRITGKPVEKENPEVTYLFDIGEDSITASINPIFIYGKYKKLIRGIPQTKWPCRKCRGLGCDACEWTGKQYKESVEELIAGPVIDVSKALSSKFHGAGREDIDAVNIAGREFVLEIKEPQVRVFDFKKLEKKINSENKGKIEVSVLRPSNRDEIASLKAKKAVKTYLAIVELDSDIEKKAVEKISILGGKTIKQRTPERVSHRRADIVRDRKVISIKAKFIDKRKIELEVEGEAGLYIKELVSGDNGRTEPSVSGTLGVKAKVTSLDVIKIE